jgi:hypothetical protein
MMRRLSGACLAALILVPLAAAKPPDLPNNPRITVVQPDAVPVLPVPLGCISPEDSVIWADPTGNFDVDVHRLTASMNELASTLHLLGVHPLIAWKGTPADAGQEMSFEPTGVWPEAPEPPSVQPYVQEQPVMPMHSLTDDALVDQIHKEIETAIHQACYEKAGEEPEPALGGCPCCSWMTQFGMCWMSRILDWCQQHCEEKPTCKEKCCAHECCSEYECPCDTVCRTIERRVLHPISADYEGMPLSRVLDELRDVSGLPIAVNEESLKKAGIASLDEIPVTFHVEAMPLKLALNQLLQPHHLQAEVQGSALCISAKSESTQGGEEASEEPAPAECGSACPKCEALHAEHAGIEEQVNGLMKACYLALEEGRFDKAAELAREAHALDPARVEGDPLIYKMQLLAQKCVIPCHGASCPSNPCRPADKEVDPATCDDPDPMPRPDLPAVDAGTVSDLDDVLTGKDKEASDDDKHGSFAIGLGLDLECAGVSLEQVEALLEGKFELPEPDKGSVVLGLSPLGEFSVKGTVPWKGTYWSFVYRGCSFLLWRTADKAE